MPDAVVVDVAQAVTSQLAAAVLSQTFTPVRSYADWELALEDSYELQVDVVAVTTEQKSEPGSRSKLKYDIPIDIAVRKRFGSEKQDDDTGRVLVSEVDALMLLVQEIYEYFTLERMTDFTSATWTSTAITAAPVPEHLHKMKQFTGLIRLTFTAYRDI